MKKTLLFLTLSAALAAAVCAPSLRPAHADSVEVLFTKEWDFSTITAEELEEDFTAAFTMENSTPRFEKVNSEEGHWFLEDGGLVRKGDITEGSTSRVAILTYHLKPLTNFRATVEYQRGSSSWSWAALGFRQLEIGMTGMDDGAYCFVQDGGEATLWGRYTGRGDPIQSQRVSGFDGTGRHTMTAEVIGNDFKLSVDGEERLTYTLPSSFYYEGYLSLMSVDNDSTFYSLKVEELSEPEIVEKPSVPPIPSANTQDSLDKMAQGEKPFDSLQERPAAPETPPTDTTDTNTGTEKQEKGCGAVLTGVPLCLTVAAGAFLAFKKKKG